MPDLLKPTPIIIAVVILSFCWLGAWAGTKLGGLKLREANFALYGLFIGGVAGIVLTLIWAS